MGKQGDGRSGAKESLTMHAPTRGAPPARQRAGHRPRRARTTGTRFGRRLARAHPAVARLGGCRAGGLPCWGGRPRGLLAVAGLAPWGRGGTFLRGRPNSLFGTLGDASQNAVPKCGIGQPDPAILTFITTFFAKFPAIFGRVFLLRGAPPPPDRPRPRACRAAHGGGGQRRAILAETACRREPVRQAGDTSQKQ